MFGKTLHITMYFGLLALAVIVSYSWNGEHCKQMQCNKTDISRTFFYAENPNPQDITHQNFLYSPKEKHSRVLSWVHTQEINWNETTNPFI